MAEHRPPRIRRGQQIRSLHVQEFLSHQRDAAHRYEPPRRFSARRRIVSTAVAARTELGTRPGPRDSAGAAPAVTPPAQSRFTFALSTREDDSDIRRLLREN